MRGKRRLFIVTPPRLSLTKPFKGEKTCPTHLFSSSFPSECAHFCPAQAPMKMFFVSDFFPPFLSLSFSFPSLPRPDIQQRVSEQSEVKVVVVVVHTRTQKILTHQKVASIPSFFRPSSVSWSLVFLLGGFLSFLPEISGVPAAQSSVSH